MKWEIEKVLDLILTTGMVAFIAFKFIFVLAIGFLYFALLGWMGG